MIGQGRVTMPRGPDALGELLASSAKFAMSDHRFTVLVTAWKSRLAFVSNRKATFFGEAQICKHLPARSRSVCLDLAHVPFELCHS